MSDPTDLPVYRELSAVCEGLETASRENAEAVQLARESSRAHALAAERLGFHDLKARMEDASLRLTEPEVFSSLDQRLNELKAIWGKWAERHRETIRRHLENRGIPRIGVLHRLKHTAGVWTKMHGKGLDLAEVHDLFAFRVIVPTEADCYAALGVVHRIFTPEVGRFKNYITRPKENGYRGLHTCVNDADGPVFEVQIRSFAMDRQAERGDAAHWIYKQSNGDAHTTREPRRWRHWLRGLSIAGLTS